MADKDLQDLVRRRLWELARTADDASRFSRWVVPPETLKRMARSGGTSFISEGLAEVGGRLLIDRDRWQSLVLSIAEQADLHLTDEDVEREWRTSQALQELGGVGGDAAMSLYADGRPRDEVIQFLIDEGLSTPARAEKSLEFIEHPLWRIYVFCYAGGETLLTDWCRAGGDETGQRARFFRLLTEQLTPSGIVEEMAAA